MARDGDCICVMLDNVTQKFTIEIRSLNGVHIDALKRLIQTKHEVLYIQQTEVKHNGINPKRY
jgi:hypothetical protein